MADSATFFNRIAIKPQIMLGKPFVKGTCLPIYLILEALSTGNTFEDTFNIYPLITRNDIQESLQYAARIAKIGFEEYEYIEVSGCISRGVTYARRTIVA